MWEQILKFDDIVVNRVGDADARASFDPETNALILNLNHMADNYKGLRDISDRDMIRMLKEAVQNPLEETEFTNFDKKNIEYMNETMGNTLTQLKNEIREKRDYTSREMELILAKFKRLVNRFIFDNTDYRIEGTGDLESIIGTLSHEGTHYGQSTIPELREKLNNTVDNLVKIMAAGIKELGSKKILNVFNNMFNQPEINLEEDFFNELSKYLVELAMLTATMEVQPALMERYGESPSLLANRILADYVEPQLKRFIENLLEIFENLGTEVDKNNLIKVIRFAQNEIMLKIGKLLDNIKYVKKSWEAVVGFDDINKGGDNFKREKEQGLHGWFQRRGGKGKAKGWISCASCGKKDGPKPCGRKDASKGRKRRCRPTCAACKTYKRRKGSP